MSLNQSHTPDGNGVLIYNGEMIILYTTNVNLKFEKFDLKAFKGTKSGALYLTSHRVIFMSNSKKDEFKSFSMPFHCLRDVKLEQPTFMPNYLKGWVQALPGGNFEGSPEWRLSFPKGGCIEFGEALLRAAHIASRARPFSSPPAYGESGKGTEQATYYATAPTYYMAQGTYQGFQAPTHIFTEQPPVGNVYMYDMPPPYPGIGQTSPYPAGQFQPVGTVQYQNVPPQPGFIVGNETMPQSGFVVGQGAAPQSSGLPTYQDSTENSQPPSYTPYQEAPPLPSKKEPL